jgi:hypothetical protein
MQVFIIIAMSVVSFLFVWAFVVSVGYLFHVRKYKKNNNKVHV